MSLFCLLDPEEGLEFRVQFMLQNILMRVFV